MHLSQAGVIAVAHAVPAGITYWQAIILGLLQGVAELFPISSLGHTVVFPALFGWHNVVASQSENESFWLAFLVGLHVGTAIALAIFYRRDWALILRGLFRSLRRRRIEGADERLGWLLVVATIPAGVLGLALEHRLRVAFAKPISASAFLLVNGFILMFGEVLRRRADVRESRRRRRVTRRQLAASVQAVRVHGEPAAVAGEPEHRSLANLDFKEAVVIGFAQTLGFLAGISRAGVTMVAGLARGLDYSDAARFSFLLATPVILLAGLYKAHDFLGPNGNGVRGQAIVGAIFAGVAAWFAVRFLTRWFTTRTLMPFAIYCLVAGTLLLIRFG